MLDAPAIGIQQSFDELTQMGEGVDDMFGWLQTLLKSSDPDEELERKLLHREETLDIVEREIMEFLAALIRGSIPRDVATETRRQLRIADEYESISDYLAGLLKLDRKRRTAGFSFSTGAHDELLALHDRVAAYVAEITQALKDGNVDILSHARTDGDVITRLFKDARRNHIARLEAGECEVLNGLIFSDMIQSYRKIKDHAINIAEAVAGEK